MEKNTPIIFMLIVLKIYGNDCIFFLYFLIYILYCPN